VCASFNIVKAHVEHNEYVQSNMAGNTMKGGNGMDNLVHYDDGLQVSNRVDDTINHGNDMTSFPNYDDGLQVEPPTTEKLIHSPGYEGLQHTTYQKSELYSDGKQVQSGYDGQSGLEPYRREEAPQGKRQPNRRRLYWGLIAGVLLLILIVVAVVVAVLVTRNHSTNKQTVSSPTTTAPSPITTGTSTSPTTTGTSASPTKTGAFNQTGLKAMDPRNTQDAVWLVFQSSTGSIQLSTLPSGGTWQPPTDLELNDAVNGTSIDAISYIVDNQIFVSSHEESYRHVQF
jgi:hypothetical protein